MATKTKTKTDDVGDDGRARDAAAAVSNLIYVFIATGGGWACGDGGGWGGGGAAMMSAWGSAEGDE